MWKVLSYILCDLDPKVKVKGKKAGTVKPRLFEVPGTA